MTAAPHGGAAVVACYGFSATLQAERPCVNAYNRMPPTLFSASASVTTFAYPVTSVYQLAPPSIDVNTPTSVPAYNRWVFAGSTTIA